ncbi:HAD family hydrolase [Kineococcus radiotolerans]|uniref:HAD-superfamily hydrolase, subfamily IA, variant 3 n=1 Tax=Kineococcus radiotolerans (strain ATCC BAA-149 / DSM 14245 / SRS30216) TaxID=266940 RepID=A6W940_KINRD|nr:HAD family phosphatase [Kineococcus radiotolerans]ABS03329.1 HAD-superfamily hydrolase, subfamily IA, variant 3 [Kineococcus radiotolerans SRS30216 = ATCC BAA-149]
MQPDSATPPTPPAAVLWDMDGTLVDTEPHWIAAETALLGRYGASWTHEQALSLVGNALPESGRVLAAHLEAETGVRLDPAAVVAELVEAVVAQVSAAVVWRPGAVELLEALAGAGVPCALVTMSYRSLAETVARVLPGAFAVVVAGDEVERGKPAPDPYLRAAELLGVDPARCVVLEDSPTGIASGEAAGCRVVACPHMVPIPPAPGRSRVASLAEVDLAVLARVAAGEVVDTVGATPAEP